MTFNLSFKQSVYLLIYYQFSDIVILSEKIVDFFLLKKAKDKPSIDQIKLDIIKSTM